MAKELPKPTALHKRMRGSPRLQAGRAGTHIQICRGVPMVKEKKLALHERILRDIEGRILSGEWPPGQPLPFEVDLART